MSLTNLKQFSIVYEFMNSLTIIENCFKLVKEYVTHNKTTKKAHIKTINDIQIKTINDIQFDIT